MASAINPIALRIAKTLWSFGYSECNRAKEKNLLLMELREDPHFERRKNYEIDRVAFPESCCFVVVLLFYVHGKHLRSCRDGQLT